MAVDVLISGVAYIGITDSLQITEQARATASTSIQVRLDALPTPVSLQSVQILIDDVPVFAGLIETVSAPEYDTGFETRVVTLSVQSLEAILNRRLITRNWYGKYVHEIVADIFTEYLAEEGLTLGSISTTTVQIDAYKKSYEQASTVLNELAKKVDGASFYIGPDKKFYFLVASDFPQVDAPDHITGLKKVDASSDLRTVQIMKGASSRIIGTAENATLKAEIAALSGTSGKIEKMESDSTIRNPTAAGTEASERVAQYAEREITLTCTCHDLVKTALYQTWAIYSGHFPTARQLPTGAALPGVSSVYPLDMTGLYTVVQRTITCYGPDQYKVAVTLKNRNFFARYGYSIRLALEDARRAGAAIDDIHSENQFTPNKKIEARAKWNAIAAEKDLLDDQADTYAIVEKKATYDAAFQALADYLNGGTAWVSGYPLWISGDELSETEEIDSDAFEGYWSGYDAGKADLSTSITAAAQAAAIAESLLAVPAYTPGYLGAFLDAAPSSAKTGDVYLRYSETSGVTYRGVFVYDGAAWNRTTDPYYVIKASRDIVEICLLCADDGTPGKYGAEADYGITEVMGTMHFQAVIADIMRTKDLLISGLLKSPVMDTVAPHAGDTIAAPTPTYWPGSAFVDHCASLADGWTAVDAASTFGGKNITHVVKGGADNTISFQSSDAEVIGSATGTLKTIVSAIHGAISVFVDSHTSTGTSYVHIKKNGATLFYYLDDWNSGNYETRQFDISIDIGDEISVWMQYLAPRQIYLKNFRLCPRSGTVAAWNNTDDSAEVIESGSYYSIAGNIDAAGLANFTTADYDTYWKGSELIALLAASLRRYTTIALDGGTFNSKTCSSIYIGLDYLTLSYESGADDIINSASYYNYSGSIVLPEVAGAVLFGDETADGQYEHWVHNIPGSTNLIETVKNKVADAIHSITETRAPDRTSGSIEATHSLHAVHNSVDFVRDISLHNYAGDMHVLDVFSNFTTDYLGDWKWYAQQKISDWAASTAYVLGVLVTNDTGKIYICTEAGTSGTTGPTGTALRITEGSARWQYLGTETESGNKMWGRIAAMLYSTSGQLWAIGGRKPTGTINATSSTGGALFAGLAPAIPQVNDTIIVSGTIDGHVIAYAERNSADIVLFRYSGGFVNATFGASTAISNVCIAW